MANYSPAAILLFFLLTSLGNNAARLIDVDHNPPAVFIFGDSSADVGTNDYIPDCPFKSNFPHYGIDFEQGNATGRWSNRYNIVDYISNLFGFARSPEPFLSDNPRHDPSSETYTGVNFASAGSGLLNRTGHPDDVVPVPEQVRQFSRVRDNLTATLGYEEAKYFISRSIFVISVGGNDIQRTYFEGLPMSESSFLETYMRSYKYIIEDLHGLGARKFGFVSVFPMGCIPKVRFNETDQDCSTNFNEVSKKFHKSLKELVISLEVKLEDFTYSLGDTYDILMKIIHDSPHPKRACCGFGKLNAEHFCNQTANLCENRNEFVFWDAVHPTDATSKVVAQELYSNSKTTYPITFSQLVNGSNNIISILSVHSNEQVI